MTDSTGIDSTLFTGLGVALATPFHAPAAAAGSRIPDGGAVDIAAFRALVRSVTEGGADFLVVLGSTGEAATVTDAERAGLVAAALEEARPRGVPVVVGAGHNATARAAALAREAGEAGAQGVLVVTPYYNKPQAGGVERHFRAVAEAAPGLPIIAYNVPGRTGMNLTPAALSLLWSIPEVVAVKESSGNLAQIGEIGRSLPSGKILLSGDDGLAVPSIALGAEGLISVAANLAPARMKALVDLARRGERAAALARHRELLPLMDALFLESNPVPLKAALALLGMGSAWPRLPLLPAQAATALRLEETMRELGLLAGTAAGAADAADADGAAAVEAAAARTVA